MTNPVPTTVMVVEDDSSASAGLMAALSHYGFLVVSVGNGRIALDQLESGNPPDVILLDLVMPEMDGWQFLSRIKETSRRSGARDRHHRHGPDSRIGHRPRQPPGFFTSLTLWKTWWPNSTASSGRLSRPTDLSPMSDRARTRHARRYLLGSKLHAQAANHSNSFLRPTGPAAMIRTAHCPTRLASLKSSNVACPEHRLARIAYRG